MSPTFGSIDVAEPRGHRRGADDELLVGDAAGEVVGDDDHLAVGAKAWFRNASATVSPGIDERLVVRRRVEPPGRRRLRRRLLLKPLGQRPEFAERGRHRRRW